MILIALGANSSSEQGRPDDTLRLVAGELPQFGVAVKRLSHFYQTEAIGCRGQEPYVNAVASIGTMMTPANLLRALKLLEERAGRNHDKKKTAKRWDSRPLDLDIIDFHGRVTSNYRAAQESPHLLFSLVLPHPRAAERPFVIAPLLDVAPYWHHPVTRRSAQQLWVRLRRREAGRVLRRLD